LLLVDLARRAKGFEIDRIYRTYGRIRDYEKVPDKILP
jgi:hypothetical protein